MQYYTDVFEYCAIEKTAVTLGKFDGLHRGHQKLLKKVREEATREQITSVVFAFDMGKKSLLTQVERRAHLEEYADCMIQCPFTKKIREMEAQDFITEILMKRLQATHIVVGTDFCFGHKKKGDVTMLSEYAKIYGFQLHVITKECEQGKEISSTAIRAALEAGAVEEANQLLGYTYHIDGEIIHGRKLGRTLGFPTMNIEPAKDKITPRFGVYVCNIKMKNQIHYGIANVGVKPTVSEVPVILTEIYVFDFDEQVYGEYVEVEYLAFVRPEMKFSSIEELKKQVEIDIENGRKYFYNR